MMDVFVISLPDRAERRANMRALMERIGVPREKYRFVDPVPASSIGADELGPGMTPGYESLNRTVRNKVFGLASTDVFLVLEDDVIERIRADRVLPRIHELMDLARTVGGAWDMIYLEYCFEGCKGAPVVTNDDDGIIMRRATKPYCTAATLYRRSSIDRIRHCLDTRGRLIDFSYADCIAKGELNAYLAWPPVFAQDAYYGAGDLAHLTPDKIQWWMNLVVRMYPDDDANDGGKGKQHRPRLPACMSEGVHYVRWNNVAILLMAMAIIIVIIVVIVIKGGRR